MPLAAVDVRYPNRSQFDVRDDIKHRHVDLLVLGEELVLVRVVRLQRQPRQHVGAHSGEDLEEHEPLSAEPLLGAHHRAQGDRIAYAAEDVVVHVQLEPDLLLGHGVRRRCERNAESGQADPNTIRESHHVTRPLTILAAIPRRTTPMISLTCCRLSFSVISHAPTTAPTAEPTAVKPSRP